MRNEPEYSSALFFPNDLFTPFSMAYSYPEKQKQKSMPKEKA